MDRLLHHPGDTSFEVRSDQRPRESRAATSIDASANGSAKTVWLSRTNPAHLVSVGNIEL